MLTLEELHEKNVTATYPPVKSITVEDVFMAIDADIIVMKIDIEGYECKVMTHNLTICINKRKSIMQALQPEILRNELGKFLPLIFIEWAHMAENSVSIILDCSADY